MSVKSKLKEAESITTKKEKELIRSLTQAYNDSYREMKKELETMINKTGGILNFQEMRKYNRIETLTNNLERELKIAESLQDNQLKTYLKDSYELNYYYAGYTLETEGLVRLNYSILDRKNVSNSINNEFLKIAIDDNKRATRQKLRRAITQSIANGEGIRESARRIKKSTEFGLNKAVGIARTETTKVISKSRQQSFEHAERQGLELGKEWIATSGNTRDTHASIDGQIVPLNEEFGNGLMFPGGDGPAEEVINCRCTHSAVLPDIDYNKIRLNKDETLADYGNYEIWKSQRLRTI